MIVGVIAVVLASTGSAVAARAITSKDIKNGTIQLADLSPAAKSALAGSRGPQGPPGAAGPAGAAGGKGDPGTLDTSAYYAKTEADARYLRRTITVVSSGTVALGNFAGAKAMCPAGYEAIGGGIDPDGVKYVHVTASNPVFGGTGTRLLNQANGQGPAASGWEGYVEITATQSSANFKVAAICAPAG